jgi:carbonic anhydrase
MRRTALGVVMVAAAAMPATASGPAPAVTPAAALERLKAGNERFVNDISADLRLDGERRAELVAGQAPYAQVLSGADSRVPPEIIFNTGLGELFLVRAAGQVLDRSVLASLEYGA